MSSVLRKAKKYYRANCFLLDHYIDIVSFLTDKKIFVLTGFPPRVVLLVDSSRPVGELIAYGIFGEKSFFHGLYCYYLEHKDSFEGLGSNLFCPHFYIQNITDGRFKAVRSCNECEMPCC